MNKISIRVKRAYLNRKACHIEARRILSDHRIEGMTENELAREIFFHALAFYFCEKTGLFPEIKNHADPIDLCDGGDTEFRKMVFGASWHISGKDFIKWLKVKRNH